MRTGIEIDNDSPLQTALKGLKPRLAAWFGKRHLPYTERALRRAAYPSNQYGIERDEFPRWIIRGLNGIGQITRARAYADSFAVLTETEKRRISFGAWIEKLFALCGELTAFGVAGLARSAAFNAKRYEVVALMQMEII